MRQLPYLGGGTNTSAALYLLRRAVFQKWAGYRRSTPSVAVVVANGESTLFRHRVYIEAAACREVGIDLVVVAADESLRDSVELKSIVSRPRERNYFTATTLSVLPNMTQTVIPAMLQCPGTVHNL